jgi:DNA/RNA-binding domain of Phe-tRNA-synthetase-like protein
MRLTVGPELESIVRPSWFVMEPVRVIDADPELETARRETTESLEALLRRIRKGEELPQINTLVDIVNWCSLETQLPFGLYDLDRIEGDVTLRIGLAGEEYEGIRKATVHVDGRLALTDARGAFGNPTSDSARTMVTTRTSRVLIVVFVPAGLPADTGERAAALTRRRIETFAAPASG